MALKLLIFTVDRETDASKYIKTATLKGSKAQCARTLTIELLRPDGNSLKTVACPVGSNIQLYENDVLRFDGFSIGIADVKSSATVTITAYDRGFYLKRNQTVLAAKGTPENITRTLAAEFGLTVGELAQTNVTVQRNFLPSSGGANSLYEIIRTLYALAGEVLGTKYLIRFEGTALCVRERVIKDYVMLLRFGSNMLDSTISESAENAITQVKVYDQEDKLLMSINDTARHSQLGLLQAIVVRRSTDKATASELAQEAIDANDIDRRLSVTNLGSSELMSGDTVAVEANGSTGVFWIDEDYHYWKNGTYSNKLVLNYQNVAGGSLSGAEVDNG